MNSQAPMETTNYAFGSLATTVIFSFVIAFGVILVFILSYFSFKYSVRAHYGIFDPIFRPTVRNSYFFDPSMAARSAAQPYVIYQGRNYEMFENSGGNERRRANRKEVLTDAELKELFPLKTYKQWLNGGKEEIQNMNKDRLGYKETFENQLNEQDHNNEHNKSNESNDIQEMSSYQPKLNQNYEEIELAEHCDITDIPIIDKKVQCTVTSTSNPSKDLESESEKHFSSGICAICLDELENNEEVRGLICGHVFHAVCIDPWLTQRRGCCPTCKRDFYLREVQEEPQQQEETTVRELNSGDQELDDIFGIETDPLAFFLILSLTRFEAQTLLATLEYTRLGEYSLNVEQGGTNESNNRPNVDNPYNVDRTMIEQAQQNFLVSAYNDRIMRQYKQENISESLDCPPLPDLSQINPKIKEIIDRQPPPFNPSDLNDLDHEAFRKTNSMMKWYRKAYWKLFSVSWLELYYHNVVRIYKNKRSKRLRMSSNQ